MRDCGLGLLATWRLLCWTNQNVTTELRHPGSLGTAQEQQREKQRKKKEKKAGEHEEKEKRKREGGREVCYLAFH